MSKGCLDHELAQQMSKCVEQLTTSGKTMLDETIMKKLKKICRTSDLYVDHAFHLLMTQLNKEHAQIRLSAFQIIDELFNRSHLFRELLIADFQNFLELTVETDQDQPLPPPKLAAKMLKTETLKSIQQWQDKYGDAYKKLALGYNYLKMCKKVDFNNIQAQTLAEKMRVEGEKRRKQMILDAMREKVRKEISELKSDIESTAFETETCVELLVPRPHSFMFTDADFSITAKSASSTVSERKASMDELLSSDVSLLMSSGNAPAGKVVVPEACSSSLPSIDLLPAESHNCLKITQQAKDICIPVLENGFHCDPLDKNISCTDSQIKDTEGNQSDSEECDENFEDVHDGVMVQAHGLGNRKYQLEIEIGTDSLKLVASEDNKDLYQTLKDSSRLISTRYLPQIGRWLEVLGKTGADQSEIKSLIDLKVRLEQVKIKCAELHLIPQNTDEESQDSDSDGSFEEVPEKEGYEPVIPSHLRAEYGLEALSTEVNTGVQPGTSTTNKLEFNEKSEKTRSTLKKQEKPEKLTIAINSASDRQKSSKAYWDLHERHKSSSVHDPTSRAANLARLGLMEETVARPSKSKQKPATVTSDTAGSVPTLPFGMDLAYWGHPEKIEAPTIVKNESQHRFWKPAEIEKEKPSEKDIAVMMNRTFHYVGEFVPVKWKCRGKLPNGKLCERMDREKCPFHGKIIPRDENGNPTKAENTEIVKLEKTEKGKNVDDEIPPWQDSELQAEIEAVTGHDLGSQRSKAKLDKSSEVKGKGKGKGKMKKKKYPGLADIKEEKNTSRARLEAKVFNRGAMKRVASQLDAADYKRVRDKFANQFNYAYSK